MTNWLIEQFDAWYDPMDLEIWFEPFGGGAGTALTAVMSGSIPETRIAEANPALAAFWTTVMDDGEKRVQHVERTAPALALFERFKQSRAFWGASSQG